MFQFRFRFILWVNNFPGHFSPPIIVAVIVSIFSLAWGSFRAFFIERASDETDPDPTLPVVMLLVLPCLIIIAINNMTMWTLTGGILGRATKRGPWVFLVMVPLFIVNVTVVTLVTREFCHSATGNRGRADDRLTRRITEACCWGICNRRRGGCQRFNQHLVDKVMHRRRQTVLTTRHRRGQIVQTMRLAKKKTTTDRKGQESGKQMISREAARKQEKNALTEKHKMEDVEQSTSFYELMSALTAPGGFRRPKKHVHRSLSTLITKLLILLTSVIIFIPGLVSI